MLRLAVVSSSILFACLLAGCGSTTSSSSPAPVVAGGPPHLDHVEPALVSPAGGTPLRLIGLNFETRSQVWVDGTQLTPVQLQSDGSLVATSLAHAPGTVDVRVVTAEGQDVLTGGLTYADPPHITGVQPNVGNVVGGEKVRIAASNFSKDPVSVTIGGQPLQSLTRVDANTVEGVVPAGTAGFADVAVSAWNGTDTLARVFEFRVWTGSEIGMNESDVDSIASHPDAPDLLYAATRGGGIFRSEDRGTTWTQAASGITHGGQNWLAVGAHDPQVVVAICQGAYLCRSTDGGRTWSTVLSTCCANQVFTDFASGAMWAAGHFYVARSLDDGASWETRYQGTQRFMRLATDPVVPGRMYGISPDGLVLRSDDTGATWSTVGAGVPSNEYLSDVLASSTANGVMLSSWNSGLYVSTDGAASFAAAAQPSQSKYERILRDPLDAGHLVASGSALVESRDEGASWTALGDPLPDSTATLHFTHAGQLYLGTYSLGLYRFDAGSWTSLNEGLTAPTGDRILAGQDRSLVLSTWPGSVYRSVDGGRSWTGIGKFTGPVVPQAALPTSRGTRVFVRANGSLSILDPGSAGWTSPGMGQIAQDPVVPGQALSSNWNTTSLTVNGGDTWTSVAFPGTAQIEALASRSTAAGTEFYALSSDGLFVLPPAGAWQQLGPGLNFFPTKLVVTPGGSVIAMLTAYGGSGAGMWRFAPGATAWATVSPGGAAYGIGTPVSGADVVMAGFSESAAISDDGGATWRPAPAPAATNVADLSFDPKDPHHVYIAAGYGGFLESWTAANP